MSKPQWRRTIPNIRTVKFWGCKNKIKSYQIPANVSWTMKENHFKVFQFVKLFIDVAIEINGGKLSDDRIRIIDIFNKKVGSVYERAKIRD